MPGPAARPIRRGAFAVAAALLALGCGADAEPTEIIGGVTVSRGAPERGQRATIRAGFYRMETVVHASAGGCDLVSYRGRDDAVDAGTITADVDGELLELEYDDGYDADVVDPTLLEPGAVVSARSPGGELAPFEASIAFPEHLSGVWMPEDGECVSLFHELRVSWEPSAQPAPLGTTEHLTVSIANDSEELSIECRADSTTSSITVPLEIFEQFEHRAYALSIARERRVDFGLGGPALSVRSWAGPARDIMFTSKDRGICRPDDAWNAPDGEGWSGS
jgi:hypothetical protein